MVPFLLPFIPILGVTLSDTPCATISVGFRSPNYQYLVTALWDNICKTTMDIENSYYTDGDFTDLQKNR